MDPDITTVRTGTYVITQGTGLAGKDGRRNLLLDVRLEDAQGRKCFIGVVPDLLYRVFTHCCLRSGQRD